VESLKTGINLIHQQFKNLLAEAGVQEIDATGQTFDPNWHEAVAQQETNDLPEGQVLRQHRTGYKLRDRLIRPASVVVAKKSAT
jgi:molecular chaperone GrpE